MDSKPLTEPDRATQAEFARLTGSSRQAIHDLVRRGIVSVGADGLIDVASARQAILASVHPSGKTARAMSETAPDQTDGAPDDQPNAATSYHVAKTLRESAEAQIAALKLAEMRGNLIRVEAVRSALGSAIATTREALLQLPARLAPVLAPESDATKVHDLMHEELQQVLGHLHAAAANRFAKGEN